VNATTFPDAVLQTLRASAARAETGDTFDPAAQAGEIRIGYDVLGPADAAPEDELRPYVVVNEPGERRTYFTKGPGGPQPYLADGSIVLSCYAPSRDSPLADVVSQALQDNPPSWLGATLNTLRETARQRVGLSDTGPEGAAVTFLTSLQFTFQYQGSA
jgi:hypothetical protein